MRADDLRQADAGLCRVAADHRQARGVPPGSAAGQAVDPREVGLPQELGGPVGVGALLVRRDARLAPLAYGGGQQRFRSGTLDAAGAAAFAVALAETVAEREAESLRLRALRDGLAAWVAGNVPGAQVTGSAVATSPHILHIVLPGRSAESMLTSLDLAGIEVSSGSACTAGVVDASHVLLAMGRSQSDAASALRVSLGRTTVLEDIEALKRGLLALG